MAVGDFISPNEHRTVMNTTSRTTTTTANYNTKFSRLAIEFSLHPTCDTKATLVAVTIPLPSDKSPKPHQHVQILREQ